MSLGTFTESWSEITKRIVFGGLFAFIALFCTYFSPLSFYALVLLLALLMYSEWLELTREHPLLNRFGGLAYIGIPIWSIIALRGTDSPEHIFVLFALVWATDIAAYIIGSRYGTHKIWTRISPGKSWEGLAGGVFAAALVGSAASFVASFPLHPLQGIIIGAFLAVVSQLGDFFESWIKRRAGVKDSGRWLPGHGGILDRVDGLMFAAPVYAILLIAFGN